MKRPTAIILISCPDQKGLVAVVTDFLHRNNGNIISLEQHVDQADGQFFMRVEWELEGFAIPAEKLNDYFATLIGATYQMDWSIHFTARKPKMAIFVTKMSHCLFDILQRYHSGEWAVEIPVIISNHRHLEPLAQRFDIPFRHLPINKENKAEQEAIQIEILEELQVDVIVLARYMQILSDQFIQHFPNKIINIHHSFLPAFKGAKPYHSAHERGVKIIGATSHYVTADLDEGPIIAQDVQSVSHKNSIKDLIRKGKDLEKVVLAQAIWLELQHKILPFKNRTVVFD